MKYDTITANGCVVHTLQSDSLPLLMYRCSLWTGVQMESEWQVEGGTEYLRCELSAWVCGKWREGQST